MKPTIVMYTHTDVMDVWSPFFGQTEKYLKDFKKVIFVNEENENIPDDYQVIVYDDSKNYRERLFYCLEAMDDEYIIFHHEDMFLYKEPDLSRLDNYTDYLKNSDKSFIKLIRGGVQIGFPDKNYPELREIDKTFEYIFAIQPTIWKKSKFIDMIQHSESGNIWEFEVHAQKACRIRNILGWYVDDGGIQRGKYHWDSKVYPYIATAVVKGRWNIREYPNELGNLFQEYNIDLSKREKNG